MRLFVAIELPESVKDQLSRLQEGVPGARWADPDQMHLTLRFVGEVDGPTRHELDHTLARVDRASFELELAGVGHFETGRIPRVLWAGVRKSPELEDLQGRVDRAVRAAGIGAEDRRFMPHVTLARLRDTPPARVSRFLAHNGLFASDPFPVEGFTLFSSVLGRGGASHRAESEFVFSDVVDPDWHEDGAEHDGGLWRADDEGL